MTMIRGQCRPPRRLCVAVVRISVVLAASTVGETRAGYSHDPSQRHDNQSPPPTPIFDFSQPHDERSSPTAPKGTEEVEKAVACFRRADYDQCLDILKAARGKDPELLPVRVILAQLFLLDNQLAQARDALERAAAEEPGCPQIWV
jgi:hypothetical protein